LSIFQSLPLCCLPQLHCIEHFSHASCCVLRSATIRFSRSDRKCSSPSLSSPRGSVVHSVSTRTQKSRNSGLWVLSSRCLFKEFSAAYFFSIHTNRKRGHSGSTGTVYLHLHRSSLLRFPSRPKDPQISLKSL
jgi:hypothetical protein